MRRFLGFGFALMALLLALWLMILQTDEEPASEETVDVSEAYEALAFWNRQRAYPNRDIPRQGLVRVFEEEQALNAARKGADVPPWEALGPHNIGGRTLALAINPQNPSTINWDRRIGPVHGRARAAQGGCERQANGHAALAP